MARQRGARLMYARHLNSHVTASVGYSYGYGSRFSNRELPYLTPAQMFKRGFFQVGFGKTGFRLHRADRHAHFHCRAALAFRR
jgi:hypothetical protein